MSPRAMSRRVGGAPGSGGKFRREARSQDGWLLDVSVLEVLLTVPMAAEDWWSASDFRRYLQGLGAEAPRPLPSVAVIARAEQVGGLWRVAAFEPDSALPKS